MKPCFSLALSLLWLLPAAGTQAQTAYTLQDLGFAGVTPLFVTGLNNRGDIVGGMMSGGLFKSYLYAQGTLQYLPGQFVGNINDSGLIPLQRLSNTPATLYNSQSGQWQTVGAPFPSVAEADVVNQSGAAAGTVTTLSGPHMTMRTLTAAIFHDGQTTDLGTLPGGAGSAVTCLNNRGGAAGYSSVASGNNHAFLYANGSLRDLGTLPGDTNSKAAGINDSGQTVGTSTSDTHSRAFLCQNGTMQDIGTLGGKNSVAYGINNAGVAVGWSLAPSVDGRGIPTPFVYSGGMMQNLLALAPDAADWEGGSAEAINDQGQIAGIAKHNGQSVFFLATPVATPEPEAFAVFGIGAFSLGWLLRRRGQTA